MEIIGADRVDVQFAAKEVCTGMSRRGTQQKAEEVGEGFAWAENSSVEVCVGGEARSDRGVYG